MSWIERKGHKSCKLNLIYRGSRDGFTEKEFHSKCDKVSPTISFIKSDKNKIFGGYTEQTWKYIEWQANYTQRWKSDDKAFLFSFSNNEKYPIKYTVKDDKRSLISNAIYNHSGSLVIYGGSGDAYNNTDMWISSSENGFSGYSYFPHSYSCSKFPSVSETSKAYLAGAFSFKVIDIELFTIIWI